MSFLLCAAAGAKRRAECAAVHFFAGGCTAFLDFSDDHFAPLAVELHQQPMVAALEN